LSDIPWSHKNRLLLAILLYRLIITASGLDYNSVYHDEALNILMGRNVLAGEHCPASSLQMSAPSTLVLRPDNDFVIF
jgi:hypothetical protein